MYSQSSNQVPLVSVIIPTKNRIDIVGRAIDSVLKQEGVLIELIVVNDGSTDGSENFIKENYPHVIIINQPNSVGGAKARNIGAANATGEYIAFLDSDDEWSSNHLIAQISFLESQKADGVYGAFYLRDNQTLRNVNFFNDFPSSYNIADKISSFRIHDARTSTFIFKRSPFLDIKFDDSLHKHQDWDLAINFEKKYKLVLYNIPTVIIHVDSSHLRMSNNLKHEATLYFLSKNEKFFTADGMFNFCVKMIMRCQSFNEKDTIKPYLQLIRNKLPNLSLKNKMLYFMIKDNLFNLNNIRNLRGRLRSYLNK